MRKTLTILSLGRLGGFGNQVFQVCTGLALARRLGAQLQVPADWPGRRMFDVDLPPIATRASARTGRDYLPGPADLERHACIDLWGYWQFQEAMDLYSRKEVLAWLPLQQWVRDRFPRHAPDAPQGTRIVIHKRRGDYLAPQHVERYCTVSDKSFYRCLYAQVIEDLGADRSVYVHEVSDDAPCRDEHCESLGLGFLPDFMKMVNADIVIRSCSTFSFWAPVFGQNRVYSPVVADQAGWSDVAFVRGNHPRFVGASRIPGFRHSDLLLREE